MVIESIGYQATAAATTGTVAAAFSGDSLAIKNAVDGSAIRLLSIFSKNQTLGIQQITAPSFNDTTRGIRWVGPAALGVQPFMFPSVQPLVPQELISALIVGTAVAGDIEQGILTIYYENSPGLQGKYITPDELISQGVRAVTVQASLTASAAGGWTGAALITAGSDLLRANTNYGVVGAQAGIQVTGMGIRAPDWSNLRLAVPGEITGGSDSQDWFARLSKMTGLPCIPVFNSANKNNIFLDLADDENGGATTVQWNLVELPPGI